MLRPQNRDLKSNKIPRLVEFNYINYITTKKKGFLLQCEGKGMLKKSFTKIKGNMSISRLDSEAYIPIT